FHVTGVQTCALPILPDGKVRRPPELCNFHRPHLLCAHHCSYLHSPDQTARAGKTLQSTGLPGGAFPVCSYGADHMRRAIDLPACVYLAGTDHCTPWDTGVWDMD